MRFFLLCLASFLINTHLFATQITIATNAFDPPFETAADNKGHFYGFEIDLMSGICKRLQLTCLYKSLTFENILKQTKAGDVDIAVDGISITFEREKTYLFSLPYMASKAKLLTLSSSPINNITQVEGKRLGVETGTVFIELAQSMFPNVKLIEYPTQSDLFQAVADEKVDIICLDAVTADFWVNNNNGLFKTASEGITVGIGYGIMANKKQAELIGAMNKALLQMENDGSYLEIYKRYF